MRNLQPDIRGHVGQARANEDQREACWRTKTTAWSTASWEAVEETGTGLSGGEVLALGGSSTRDLQCQCHAHSHRRTLRCLELGGPPHHHHVQHSRTRLPATVVALTMWAKLDGEAVQRPTSPMRSGFGRTDRRSSDHSHPAIDPIPPRYCFRRPRCMRPRLCSGPRRSVMSSGMPP